MYKLVGPILVKQSVDEAKVDVERRLEFIGGEMWVLAPFPPTAPSPSSARAPVESCGTHTMLFSSVEGWGGARVFPLGVPPPGAFAGVTLAGEWCGGCTRTPFHSNPPRSPTQPHTPSVFLNSTRSEKRIKDHQEQMEVLRKSIAALGAAKSG